jgi:hypothetical protein
MKRNLRPSYTDSFSRKTLLPRRPSATKHRPNMDAVLETTKALSPRATKKDVEAAKVQDEAEAGPSAPIETKVAAHEDKTTGQIVSEKTEAPNKDIDYIIRHASGKKLSKEEILEARDYAQRLKYPKGP